MTELISLMAEVLALPPEEVVDDLSMMTCETWDSLCHMDVIVSIESVFGIDLTADEIAEMTSVGAIKGVLSAKGV